MVGIPLLVGFVLGLLLGRRVPNRPVIIGLFAASLPFGIVGFASSRELWTLFVPTAAAFAISLLGLALGAAGRFPTAQT